MEKIVGVGEFRKKRGDDGHRSHYLSHAKRPLYHLSYIPLSETAQAISKYIQIPI